MNHSVYLEGGREEVVLRHNVNEEVWRDFPELVVEHGDEAQVQLLVAPHGILRAAEQSQQTLPVLKAVVNVPDHEAHKRKLELACWRRTALLK